MQIPVTQINAASVPIEVDYVAVTSPVSITATTEGTAQVLVTGTSLAWDGTTAYMFELFSPYFSATSTTTSFNVILYDGSGVIGYVFLSRAAVAATSQGAINALYRFVPAAGTRAYSFRAFSSAANTVSVAAGVGGGAQDVPMFMRVTRV